MAASKLQASMNNMHSQLKVERMSSLAKDTRPKYLEDLIIKLGYDPSNVKAAEDIIKNKMHIFKPLRNNLRFQPQSTLKPKK